VEDGATVNPGTPLVKITAGEGRGDAGWLVFDRFDRVVTIDFSNALDRLNYENLKTLNLDTQLV